MPECIATHSWRSVQWCAVTAAEIHTRWYERTAHSDRFNVPVPVTQICSVTNAVTVGWAWPLTTLCDFTALWEQELHRWRLQQPTLSAFVSVVVSQLLSPTIGSGKLTRPCKRCIYSYNSILQLHTSVYRTTNKIFVMILSNAPFSRFHKLNYWYWHSKSSSVGEINGLETGWIRSNIFPLFTCRLFYTTQYQN